jgi:hypothetical protein
MKTDAETAEEQRKEQQEASDRRWTRGLAIATSLIGLLQLIAITFQAGIAYGQNQITRRQNAIMEAQSAILDGQREASRDAALASENSARIAESTLLTSQEIQRANIGLNWRQMRPVKPGPEIPFIKFIVEVRNVGPTAGQILAGLVGFSIGRNPSIEGLIEKVTLIPEFLHPTSHLEWNIKASSTDDPRMDDILRGTGNTLNNTLIGTDGANTLNGGAGADDHARLYQAQHQQRRDDVAGRMF